MTMNINADYIYDNALIKMINPAKENHDNYTIPYLDMIAEFQVRVDNNKTFAITRKIFSALNLDEDILLARAKLNMISNVKIASMGEILGVGDIGDDLTVVSNKNGWCGAGVIMIPELFRSISNKDLFILPSSIHEVLALPDDGNTEVEFLQSMVSEINKYEVAEDERLTDSVYKYFHEDNKIKKVG